MSNNKECADTCNEKASFENISFEEALRELENIVNQMEEGDLTLDDSLSKFELGIKYSRICSKKLETAERKIEVLLASEDGETTLKPFDIPEAQNE